MSNLSRPHVRRGLTAFGVSFGICLVLGIALAYSAPVSAAPVAQDATPPATADGEYLGPDLCKACHEDIHQEWSATLHAAAFSSPIFQESWTKDPNKNACLQCHTTGYDANTGAYAFEGVTCESCHGPYLVGHPQKKMPITPDATLCSTCHKTTTDEWRASRHGEAGIQCQACHNPHTQTPKAENVNALCSNCHKDTVHTRDKIVALTGEVTQLTDLNVEALRQKAQAQEQEIASLQATSDTRLYVGLAQGAIVGLATGGVAAWIVSRRIRVVEETDEDDKAADGKRGD